MIFVEFIDPNNNEGPVYVDIETVWRVELHGVDETGPLTNLVSIAGQSGYAITTVRGTATDVINKMAETMGVFDDDVQDAEAETNAPH